MPTGYEFISFVKTIRQVADGEPRLLDDTVTTLATLTQPVMITVFSTKT